MGDSGADKRKNPPGDSDKEITTPQPAKTNILTEMPTVENKDAAFFTTSGLIAFMERKGFKYVLKTTPPGARVMVYFRTENGRIKMRCLSDSGFLVMKCELGTTTVRWDNTALNKMINDRNIHSFVGKFGFRGSDIINSVTLPVFDNPLSFEQLENVWERLLVSSMYEYPKIQRVAWETTSGNADDHSLKGLFDAIFKPEGGE